MSQASPFVKGLNNLRTNQRMSRGLSIYFDYTRKTPYQD